MKLSPLLLVIFSLCLPHFVLAQYPPAVSPHGPTGQINAMGLQADGKIIVTGAIWGYNGIEQRGIARINTDGTLDRTFDPGSGFVDGQSYQLPPITYQPSTHKDMLRIDAPELLVFPNPNNGDELHLRLTQLPNGVDHVDVKMMDIAGRLVLSQQIIVSNGDQDHLLDLRSIQTKGIFLVYVRAGEERMMERLVIE